MVLLTPFSYLDIVSLLASLFRFWPLVSLYEQFIEIL